MYKWSNALLVKKSLPVALFLCVPAGNAEPQKQHLDLSIRITTQVVDGRVINMKVVETFDQRSTAAGTPLRSMPIVTDAVPGVLSDPLTFSGCRFI